MRSVIRFGGTVAACVAATALLVRAAEQRVSTPTARIALTFDDLPVHRPLPAGVSPVQVARSIVGTLTKYRVSEAYGFVNANALDENPEYTEVLRLWRAAGLPLGNHAWSHMDLHANSVQSFERDLLANEPALRTFMGDLDWRWFRFPFLREGDTPEKYAAVRALLAKNGYRVAQVTISFDDYAYNGPYVRCLSQGDDKGIAWLEQSYLERAADSLVRGHDTARRLFGRDISHVMLLHVGAFQMVMLPRLMELLHEKGYTLVTLQDAQADEAYRATPRRPGPRAGTFLEQLEARTPPAPSPSRDALSQLDALCRSVAP